MKPNSSLAVNFRARAGVTRHQPLGKFRQLVHRLQHALAEHKHTRERCDDRQPTAANSAPLAAPGSEARVEQRQPARMLAGVIRQPKTPKQRRADPKDQQPDCRTQTSFHDFLPRTCALLPERNSKIAIPNCQSHPQITGTGNTSVSRRRSTTSANRSSCRNIPRQCGTSAGA